MEISIQFKGKTTTWFNDLISVSIPKISKIRVAERYLHAHVQGSIHPQQPRYAHT